DRPRRSANRRSNSRSGIPPVSSPRRSASAPGSSRKSRLTASSSSPLSRQNSAKLSQTEVVSTPPKSTRRPVWVPSARIGFAAMGDEAIGEDDAASDGRDEAIDASSVEAWFAEQVEGAEPPLRFERISGGRSNLTYRVSDAGGRSWALRRPPLGKR